MAQRGLVAMGVRFKQLLGGFLAAAAIVAASGSLAVAQGEDQTLVVDEVDDTFFGRNQDFYENSRFPRSLTWIFGPFPENEISSDGENLTDLYDELLEAQVTSDSVIRTTDLASPYASSLLSEPIYTPQPFPAAAPSSFRSSGGQAQPISPGTGGGTGSGPVPALW